MKRVILLCFISIVQISLHAQSIAINESGDPPNAKSILDISSTTKGLLIPRMTSVERLMMGVAIPDKGMLVYDIDLKSFMFFDGSMWQSMGGSGGGGNDTLWYLSGDGIQNAVDNVGIGGDPVMNLPLRVTNSFGKAAEMTNTGFYADYTLKLKNTAGTALAAFSGFTEDGPLGTPAAIYGYGSDGANGAYLVSAAPYGAGVVAQSQGFGPALNAYAAGDGLSGWFHGGNVHIEDSVGIGTDTPLSPLHVFSALSGDVARFASNGNTLLRVYRNNVYAGFIQSQGDDFILGRPNGDGNLILYNTSAENSLKLEADGDVGIGVTGSAFHKLHVEGIGPNSLIKAEVIYEGENDVRAIEGISTPIGGYGYGGHFTGGYYGVYGTGEGDAFIGTTTGVYGNATGTTGTRIGLWGAASGGMSNWAGYFTTGNVYVENQLGIGSTQLAAGYQLSVDGKIMCEELKVQNSVSWPDYVFAPDYPLLTTDELKTYIDQYRHLPGIPSAVEISKQGIDVGDMQRRMMEKIEELTLYIIAQDKRIEILEAKAEAKAKENKP
ncbi:MAG TPA: hypothetical protein VI603_03410 [Saprospiraceae bacterium]|nr:hypothetical protein [Saprospiraceae bacterium]